MRRIAIINQKGGVGKTTTAANLGAALAQLGRRVVLIDLDPQGNLSLHLERAIEPGKPSTYTVLSGETTIAQALLATSTPRLALVPSNIDLSGAELELASAIGRESILRDALDAWEKEAREKDGAAPADYLLIDCPPSLGLLSINGLVAAGEAMITLQTEFFALQGMSKLVEVLKVLKKRLNPALEVSGILPCMYDSRLKLAREVLSEIRSYFPGQVFARAIGKNVKLAEAPSYGKTIFEYAPECSGAADYRAVSEELVAQESERDPELAAAPRLAPIETAVPERRPPPPRAVPASAADALRDVVLVPVRAVEPAPPPNAPSAQGAPSAALAPARNGSHTSAVARIAAPAELELLESCAVAIAEPSESPVADAEEPAELEAPSAPESKRVEELPPLPDDAVLLLD